MSNIKLNLNCCLCSDRKIIEVELPKGWVHRYGGIDEEHDAFCPTHAIIGTGFCDQQCQGCVGGWGDCDLWSAFAYSSNRSITEDKLDALETGVCPYRTNGTFGFSDGKMERINLSERGTDAAGKALADAIRSYIAQYPTSGDRQ